MASDNTAGGMRGHRIQTFQFEKRIKQDSSRAEIKLCANEQIRGIGHVIHPGECNELHYETGVDEFWIVLAGRARFCGSGRMLIGEFSVNDGIMIPRNTEYLIENVGPDTLELIQVAAIHRGSEDKRVELVKLDDRGPVDRFSGRAL
jgi:mannose-6-phosphate isomerase-like protein (cupin superfamily)